MSGRGDDVRVGQEARRNFSALDQRRTPPVPGEVVHVSADRLENERTPEVYYLARLRISSERLPTFDPAQIGPVQPVEVFITTVERTLGAYLAEPITAVLAGALKKAIRTDAGHRRPDRLLRPGWTGPQSRPKVSKIRRGAAGKAAR